MNGTDRILAVGFLSFFFLTGATHPPSVFNVAVIDLQKILDLSDAGKSAQMEINMMGKQMETDLKEKSMEIAAIEKEIKVESLALNETGWEERQRLKRIKIGDFKDLRHKYLDDLKALESRVTSRIQNEVVRIIQDIGTNKGYAMIVEKRAGGVVYAPPSMDITDSVIGVYNTRFQKSKSGKSVNTAIPGPYPLDSIQARLTFSGPSPGNAFLTDR